VGAMAKIMRKMEGFGTLGTKIEVETRFGKKC
jgi:hypothetical protein